MDKIKLEGDVKYSDGRYADITLTPDELKEQLKPDLSQLLKVLKVRDRVWIEWEVSGFSEYLIDLKQDGKLGLCRHTALPSDIIAHFSSKPEKEKVELPEKLYPLDPSLLESKIVVALNKLIDVVREMKEK